MRKGKKSRDTHSLNVLYLEMKHISFLTVAVSFYFPLLLDLKMAQIFFFFLVLYGAKLTGTHDNLRQLLMIVNTENFRTLEKHDISPTLKTRVTW